MGTTGVTDTIGRLWIAGFTPVFLIGAYESWTADAGWWRALAVPFAAGAIATASYVLPRRRSTCAACGEAIDATPGARFCPACGTSLTK